MPAAFDLQELFGPHGRLAGHLPGFAVRGEQLQMAEEITRAMLERYPLIVEAGTGVGKTFAYLAPALLAGKRVIISTGTRSLQDQLFNRDLPMMTAVLGRPVRIALLKGRSNYLCLQRLTLAQAQGEARGFNRELALSLRKVMLWSQQTRKGDIGELAAVAEGDAVWPWVTSTRENCLGAECSLFDRCLVVAARREAQAADIVVVNHHLLMADLMLKENGFGDLLPGADAVIVDEAHQLPDVATQAFGTNISARQLRELARDVTSTQLLATVAGIGTTELNLMQSLEEDTHAAVQAFSTATETLDFKAWPEVAVDALIDCRDVLRRFATNTATAAEDQTELRALHERALDLAERCDLFVERHSDQQADDQPPASVR
jgi:ATP-dependent DNA helicase DinG